MPVPVGSFYINNSNQDFYLKELVNGVPAWVRKGNIRDDGTSGVLTVSPVIGLGFDLNSVVQRVRFLPESPSDIGFVFSDLNILRIRSLTPGAMDFGLAAVTSIIGELILGNVGFDFGMVQPTTLLSDVRIVASMDFGMTQASALNFVRDVSPSPIDFGMTQTTLYQIALSASMSLGFTQTSAIEIDLNTSMALGFTMASTLTHTPTTLSLNLTWVNYTPSAVNTTFTYASQGALEANLYDGSLTTNAADPTNFSATTKAAYDLGSAKDVRAVSLTTGSAFGFQFTGYFDISYSDTSLTAGFTSVGKTITALAGTSNSARSALNSGGSHRYWRISYYAGTTGGNGWLADLEFQTNMGPNLGFDMAAALTLTTLAVQTPTAVNTTFTYTTAAAEANLYDGSLTTNAADPLGLTVNTKAAYDLGSAKAIIRMIITTGSANGWSQASVFKLQYSDTSLTAGFTDVTSGSFTIQAGLSKATVLDFTGAGSHRYWRIVYVSGTTGQNAWLAELDLYM